MWLIVGGFNDDCGLYIWRFLLLGQFVSSLRFGYALCWMLVVACCFVVLLELFVTLLLGLKLRGLLPVNSVDYLNLKLKLKLKLD